jgi:exosortase
MRYLVLPISDSLSSVISRFLALGDPRNVRGDGMAETLEEGSTESRSFVEKVKQLTLRHPTERLKFLISGAKISLILLLLGFIYHPTFIWMWGRWFAADSYYAHGPLIPIVSVVLIWLKLKRLRKLVTAQVVSSKLGLGFLLVGLLLHIASASTRVYFSSAYSLLFVLIGLVLYFFGKEATRIILFPLCFLLLMVPAPMAVIAASTLKMKLFVAHISVSIIQFSGVSAVREGSMVYMPNTSIVVGDPCSGLRSLISLSALGILYAYIVRASYLKKVSLFLISIPVAIIANMIRTTAILFIANSYGNKIVTDGFLHEGFGLMVFVIAFAGLFLAGRLLGCRISQGDI